MERIEQTLDQQQGTCIELFTKIIVQIIQKLPMIILLNKRGDAIIVSFNIWIFLIITEKYISVFK